MPNKSKDNAEGFLARCGRGITFLFRFLRHPIRMGAPLPCNRQIADTIRDELRAVNAQHVVELGAGLGSLTRGILDALPEDIELLCIERDETFCKKVEKRFGDRVRVVRGNALNLGDIIKDTPWETPDAIVCSVPLIIEESDDLVQTVYEYLPPDGLYLQVANFRKPIEAMFDVQKSYFFPTNIPPERLHSAVHKKQNAETE